MTSKNLIVNAALLMSEFKKKQIKNPIVANAVHQYKQMKAEEESAKLNKPSVSNPVVARALEDFKAKVRNGEIAPIVENWAKKGTPEWDKHVDHMREVTGNPNWGEGTKTGDKPSEGKKEENKEGAQKEEKKEISAEEKKESPEERNKDTDNKGEGKKPTERDLGSKVRNTANGIESVTSDNFSMGINTGDKEKDIDEAYKRAEESQEEFKDAVKSVGSQ